MRSYILLIIFCFACQPLVHAQQNHVPNGSFENNTGCPTKQGQISLAAPWYSYNYNTPDYYHTCATQSQYKVPNTLLGFQQAIGNGYAGLTWSAEPNSTEYLATPITPLQAGVTYEVSMYVCLANAQYKNASNALGVFFFNKGPKTRLDVGRKIINTQVDYSSFGVLADTQNWVRLTKTFVADSAYDNLVIGNFKAEPDITYAPGAAARGYYFIDSVVIKSTWASSVFNTLALEDNIGLYPNPNNGVFTIKGNMIGNGMVKTEILNAIGQVVHRDVFEVFNHTIHEHIQAETLPPGIYVLKLSTPDGRVRFLKYNKQQ